MPAAASARSSSRTKISRAASCTSFWLERLHSLTVLHKDAALQFRYRLSDYCGRHTEHNFFQQSRMSVIPVHHARRTLSTPLRTLLGCRCERLAQEHALAFKMSIDLITRSTSSAPADVACRIQDKFTNGDDVLLYAKHGEDCVPSHGHVRHLPLRIRWAGHLRCRSRQGCRLTRTAAKGTQSNKTQHMSQTTEIATRSRSKASWPCICPCSSWTFKLQWNSSTQQHGALYGRLSLLPSQSVPRPRGRPL